MIHNLEAQLTIQDYGALNNVERHLGCYIFWGYCHPSQLFNWLHKSMLG